MKIAYLSRSCFPSHAANSIHVMKMCEAFASLGHDVLLLGNLQGDSIHRIFDYYGINTRFSVKHVYSIKGSATDLAYIAGVVIAAKNFRPHIAYGRLLEACFGTSILGIPTVFEIHAPPRTLLKRVILKKLIARNSLKRIVTITKGLAYYLIREGFLKPQIHDTPQDGISSEMTLLSSKLCVAHDGADPNQFDFPSGRSTEKTDRLQVGYIGSLYRGKGMELISKLIHLCPWADFHIVGGQPSEITFWKNICSRSGVLPTNVHFYGFVPHALVSRICSHLDVALMPTQPSVLNVSGNRDEGWHVSPLKLFEYMASGLPILASDLESVREVLENGVTGFLLPPDDPYAWRDALIYLRDHPDVRIEVGKNARETLIKNFSWKARAKKVLNGLP